MLKALLPRTAWAQAGLSIRLHQSVSQSVSQSVCLSVCLSVC